MARAVEYDNCQHFLVDDATLPVNVTTSMTAANMVEIDTHLHTECNLYLYVKGNAGGCSKKLTFYFQISPNGTQWHDMDALEVTMDGTDTITTTDTNVQLDLTTVDYIRLQRVTNAELAGDPTHTANINAWLRRKSGVAV